MSKLSQLMDRDLKRRRRHPPAVALFIGHSHLVAVRNAWDQGAVEHYFAASFVLLGSTEYPAGEPGGDALGEAASRAIAAARDGIVICATDGNEHNVLGLLNHPRRFDFVLPEREQMPLDHTAQLLPSALLRSVMARLVSPGQAVLAAIRAHTPRPMIYLESPPPVPQEDHIRRYPGVFRTMIDELGVAPAGLRYKLWRVQSGLYQDVCREMGITFLPVPPVTQDADGMMVPQAWNPDPTHGNAWFGAQRLAQLRRFVQ